MDPDQSLSLGSVTVTSLRRPLRPDRLDRVVLQSEGREALSPDQVAELVDWLTYWLERCDLRD